MNKLTQLSHEDYSSSVSLWSYFPVNSWCNLWPRRPVTLCGSRTHIHVHIHTYTNTHKHLDIPKHTYTHAHLKHTYTHTYTCTYLHIDTNRHSHSHMAARLHPVPVHCIKPTIAVLQIYKYGLGNAIISIHIYICIWILFMYIAIKFWNYDVYYIHCTVPFPMN